MAGRLIHGDCLDVLPTLEDASVDAVITDPPYFRVKGEAWDRQWKDSGAFLEWLGRVADEWRRVLRGNGSVYCFASPRMAARVEVMLGERFEVLENITWVKPDPSCSINYGAGRGGSASKEALRSWFPRTEEIIFAEHKGADGMARGESGWTAKCDELRGFVFEPLRAYLDGERVRAGVDKVACNVACGFSASPGGMASRHYFARSQWQLPTREHYEALRALFNRRPTDDYLRREYEDLRREYEDLRREYEDLRREYEDLRRPFNVTADVPYTDVWTFPTVSRYPGKHPCEKPQALLRHILEASTKPGAVVLDTFMGTGSLGEACAALGREFVGIERDDAYFSRAQERLAEPELFADEEAA